MNATIRRCLLTKVAEALGVPPWEVAIVPSCLFLLAFTLAFLSIHRHNRR